MRIAGLRFAAYFALAASCSATAGCDGKHAPDAAFAQFTSTTLYDCVADEVIVDPDSEVGPLLPNCPIQVPFEVRGRGTFDAFLSDDADGQGYHDIIGVGGGERLSLEYTPPDILPESVTVSVWLEPHSPGFVCVGATYGASGQALFEAAAPGNDCSVTFRVPDEIDLGRFYFQVDYSARGSDLIGCGGAGIVCTSQVASRVDVFDRDVSRQAEIYTDSGTGYSAPADVVRCRFPNISTAAAPLSSADFAVTVLEAGTPPPIREPIDLPPSLDVEVDCSAGSVTTTTLPFTPAACGRPCSTSGSEPTVRDALYVLRAATALVPCETCLCDVNRSGSVDATDALAVLARSVGLDTLVRCVTCSAPIEPACD